MPESYSQSIATEDTTPIGPSLPNYPFGDIFTTPGDALITVSSPGITSAEVAGYWTHVDVFLHRSADNAIVHSERIALAPYIDGGNPAFDIDFEGLINGLQYLARARAVRVTP